MTLEKHVKLLSWGFVLHFKEVSKTRIQHRDALISEDIEQTVYLLYSHYNTFVRVNLYSLYTEMLCSELYTTYCPLTFIIRAEVVKFSLIALITYYPLYARFALLCDSNQKE